MILYAMQQTKRVPRWGNPVNAIIPRVSYAGVHLIADFWNGKIVEEEQELERLLREAAKASRSEVLEVSIHKFAPQGITGVVLLAESHIALHTWPEIRYIAIDIFTCGKEARPKEAFAYLKDELQPQRVEVKKMKRGKI